MVKLKCSHFDILIKLGVLTVEKKIMHKSKGRWVVLSSSLLVSAFALSMATPVAQAEELTDDSSVVVDNNLTSELVEEASTSLTGEEAEIVESAVDELVSEVMSVDEALEADETGTEIEEVMAPVEETVVTEEASEVEAVEATALADTAAVFASTRVAAASYTVVNGDTLWKVANAHGITVEQIRSWNKLSSDMILVGDKLLVTNPGTTAETPSTTKPKEKPVTETETPAPTTSTTYTVRPGDYLSTLR